MEFPSQVSSLSAASELRSSPQFDCSEHLDWQWLLQWAEMTVEGAIRHRMWGWTPHNYAQPQFKNWQDVRWHQKLTSRFLNS